MAGLTEREIHELNQLMWRLSVKSDPDSRDAARSIERLLGVVDELKEALRPKPPYDASARASSFTSDPGATSYNDALQLNSTPATGSR